jgi:hypothetical protein
MPDGTASAHVQRVAVSGTAKEKPAAAMLAAKNEPKTSAIST